MLQTSVDGLPITCIRTCPSDSHILAAAGQHAFQFNVQYRSQLIVSGSDGALTLWNVVGGKRIDTIVQPNNEINALDYSPDGSMFATAGKVGHLLVDINFYADVQLIRMPTFLYIMLIRTLSIWRLNLQMKRGKQVVHAGLFLLCYPVLV